MAHRACEAKLRRVLPKGCYLWGLKNIFKLLLPFYYIHTTYQTSISKRQFSLEKKKFFFVQQSDDDASREWWRFKPEFLQIKNSSCLILLKNQVKNQKILINFLQIPTQITHQLELIL